MSIVGIGIDIVEISRLEKILKKFKIRFARKILSKKEWLDFLKTKNDVNFLAKRFAVKEAASKSIGTGFRNLIFLKNFELYHNNLGKPKIKFLNQTQHIINQLNISSVHVTICDEKKYVIALIILENKY